MLLWFMGGAASEVNCRSRAPCDRASGAPALTDTTSLGVGRDPSVSWLTITEVIGVLDGVNSGVINRRAASTKRARTLSVMPVPNIRPTRMRTATDARNTFNELLGEAERGIMTHIVKGSRVVAHLVPANAKIIDDTAMLALVLGAVGEREAAYAAEHLMRDGRLWIVGDHFGRLLGWAWQVDLHVFCQALAIFHNTLEAALGREVGRSELVSAVQSGLGARLTDSEVHEACEYLAGDEYWNDYRPHPPQ